MLTDSFGIHLLPMLQMLKMHFRKCLGLKFFI